MNEVVHSVATAGLPAPPARRQRTEPALSLSDTDRGASSDREFLAPVLEILETPASPVRVAFLWIICALVVVALGLAYFGRIDIIASAQGKFQPTGRVKVIQPVETGRVVAVHAANGTLVKAGDVLVELDRSAAEADVRAANATLKSAEAESLRRRAALAAARDRAFSARPEIAWPDDLSANLRAREEGVLAADLGQLSATIASFEAQKTQKAAERDMLEQTIATQRNLIATLQKRVDMRTELVASQSGAKSAVIDATETLQYQQTQLAIHEEELSSATTGLDVIARDSEKAVQAFLSDQAQKLDDSERRAEENRQHLAKAEAMVDTLTLRAPIDGRVQSSIITNVGQVVDSGQEIMRIVPQNSRLEIEAYVQNQDIGFVRVGQEAVIKVEVVSVHPLRFAQGAGRAHRQGRHSLDGRERHRGRSDPRVQGVRLRRRGANPKSGVRGRTRTRRFDHHGRRSREALDLGHGHDRGNQDRLAPSARIPLLSGDGGRFEGDARAVGAGVHPAPARPRFPPRGRGHAPAARACCGVSCARIMSRSRTR